MPGNIISLTPETIAAWPKSNYVDPYERPGIPAIMWVFCGLATLLVGTRLWLRTRAKILGLDDLLLALSWLVMLGYTVCGNLIVSLSMANRHMWDIPPNKFPQLVLFVWFGEQGYLISGCFVRISVLLFYRRLVEGTYSKRWKWAIWAAIAFTATWSLAFVLACFLKCRPFWGYWEAFSPTPSRTYDCINTSALNDMSGAFGILGDIYAIVLPFGLTWRLQMPKRQKLALNSIFAMGVIILAASIFRTVYTIRVGTAVDVSWAVVNVFVWAQIELTLSMMCASAPALRVLFRRYLSGSVSRVVGAARGAVSGNSSRPKSPGPVIEHLGSASGPIVRNDFSGVKPAMNSRSREIDEEKGERPWSAAHLGAEDERILMGHEYEMQNMEKAVRELHSQNTDRTQETFYEDRSSRSSSRRSVL